MNLFLNKHVEADRNIDEDSYCTFVNWVTYLCYLLYIMESFYLKKYYPF